VRLPFAVVLQRCVFLQAVQGVRQSLLAVSASGCAILSVQ
jgi:hypothetical protein